MTRFRFRGHRGATDAINALKRKTAESLNQAKRNREEDAVHEKTRKEYEDRKKKQMEVKEEKEDRPTKIERDSFKHGPRVWDEKRKKFVDAWKTKEKKHHANVGTMPTKEKPEERWKWKPWGEETEDIKPGFDLPKGYGGDYSVRKIYEARSGRSLGGASHDVSYGRGLYGSVADSPVRAQRPVAAKPTPKAVAKPAVAKPSVPLPQRKPQAAAPSQVGHPPGGLKKPAPTTTSVPVTHPKATGGKGEPPSPNQPQPTVPVSSSGPTTQAKSVKPSTVPSVPAPTSAGISIGPSGVKKDKGPISTYADTHPGAAQKDAGPGSHLTGASADLKTILTKDPEGPTQKSLTPGLKPSVPPPGAQSSAQLRTKIQDVAGSQVTPPSPAPSVKRDTGPSSHLTAAGAELKSILARDANAPTQSSLTPGLKVTPTPPAVKASTIRNKVKDIAGPLLQGEEKVSLPTEYGGDNSVRKLYDEGAISKFVKRGLRTPSQAAAHGWGQELKRLRGLNPPTSPEDEKDMDQVGRNLRRYEKHIKGKVYYQGTSYDPNWKKK